MTETCTVHEVCLEQTQPGVLTLRAYKKSAIRKQVQLTDSVSVYTAGLSTGLFSDLVCRIALLVSLLFDVVYMHARSFDLTTLSDSAGQSAFLASVQIAQQQNRATLSTPSPSPSVYCTCVRVIGTRLATSSPPSAILLHPCWRRALRAGKKWEGQSNMTVYSMRAKQGR